MRSSWNGGSAFRCRRRIALSSGLVTVLYVTPNDDSTGLRILAASYVAAATQDLLSDLRPTEQRLIVCGFGPESDWIVLNPAFGAGEEYAVLAGDHDDAQAALTSGSIIAASFGDFLDRVLSSIAAGSEFGALYWLKDSH